jgi:hypothetical protein
MRINAGGMPDDETVCKPQPAVVGNVHLVFNIFLSSRLAAAVTSPIVAL